MAPPAHSAPSERKTHHRGTHRTRHPAETFADFSRHRAHFGITRVANITGLDTIGLPVFQAIRPNSRSLATSQGKGLDDDAARTSALMESIEGWHAEHIVAPIRYDSYAGLRRSAAAIDPQRFPGKPGLVIRPYEPLMWLEGHELLRDGPVWVPYETVTTNLVATASTSAVFPISSNGLASGNTPAEAACHALYELIERDAAALAQIDRAGGQPPPRIDPSTVTSPEVQEVGERFGAAGASWCVFDITSDVGIPCFECVLGDPRDTAPWSRKGLCGGSGCHLDPGIAILRAMTEAAQSRVTLIAGSRDDTFGGTYESMLETSLTDPIAERLFSTPMVPLAHTGHDAESFDRDLETIVGALREAGMPDVILVDLSHPAPHVPVVRALVPGLEPVSDQRLYAPGPRARARVRAREST